MATEIHYLCDHCGQPIPKDRIEDYNEETLIFKKLNFEIKVSVFETLTPTQKKNLKTTDYGRFRLFCGHCLLSLLNNGRLGTRKENEDG